MYKVQSKVWIGVICVVLACAALALAGCGQGTASSAASTSASSAASTSGSGAAGSASAASGSFSSGVHHAKLTVEGYDPITIELDADDAPISVANFCALAESGYYDGLTFYRFVDGFCMQGGTKGNSASGNDSSLTPIAGEFSSNGYNNALADNFKKGVVAMARTSNPNSATSTFFVTLGSGSQVSAALDGQYAAFGTIGDAGMAIVDQIVSDYLPNVSDAQMGAIADESKQAKITSIEIVD